MHQKPLLESVWQNGASGGIRTRDPRLTNREIDWQKFEQWVSMENIGHSARDRVNYARKFCTCLLRSNLSDLKLLSDDQRLHAMKALSALAKFVGQYQNWLSMVKNYGLKWSSRNTDDIIIARLSKTTDAQEISDWVKKIKSVFPELKDFMDLLPISGLRYTEALSSYNLIIKLSKEGKLQQYYNNERELLERFRFKEIFLRRTKKAFISFVPRDLIQRIAENQPLTKDSVDNKVKRKKLPRRFGDTRELFGTLAQKNLTPNETDFVQGRVSTVFLKHYYNPSLLSDLKNRAFKVVDEIESQIQ
jgi:hypothetical protein